MNSLQMKRDIYLKEAGTFFETACLLAQEGDIQTSASLILKALDQERRASVVGPQVLQLIKN